MNGIIKKTKIITNAEALFDFINTFYTGEGISEYLRIIKSEHIAMIQRYVEKNLFSKHEKERCFMYAYVKPFLAQKNFVFHEVYENTKFLECANSVRIKDFGSSYVESLIQFVKTGKMTKRLEELEEFIQNMNKLELDLKRSTFSDYEFKMPEEILKFLGEVPQDVSEKSDSVKMMGAAV